jgi:hypothetical protein
MTLPSAIVAPAAVLAVIGFLWVCGKSLVKGDE